MTAWQKLLANSSLSSGTAWQLLNAPQVGTGTGTIISDGYKVQIGGPQVVALVQSEDVLLVDIKQVVQLPEPVEVTL